MKVFKVLFSIFVLLCVCACDSSRQPAPNDTQFLDQLGFNQPIAAAFQINQVYGASGAINGSLDSRIAAVMATAGYITVDPDTSAAPWFHFNLARGSAAGGVVTIPFARRVVLNRSEEKSWSEGPIDFYAETISYQIVLDDGAQKAASFPSPSFSFRLVVKRDPAIGRWTIFEDPQRGTTFPDGDVQQVADKLFGLVRYNALGSGMYRARTAAMDQIERQIAAQTGIEKGGQAFVVINHRAKIAFYFPYGSFGGRTLGDFDAICRTARLSGYGNWRWAGRNDLSTAINSNGNLIDTPDHRLWPGLGNVEAVAPLNSFHLNDGSVATLDAVNQLPATGGFYWRDDLNLHENGYGAFSNSAAPATNAAAAQYGSSWAVKVICVTSP